MTKTKILRRIRGKGRGAIVASCDFLDLGSRASVNKALSRLAKQGVIRRLVHGLYDYPEISQRFGFVQPRSIDVARAIARKNGRLAQVHPLEAANITHLSTQVPAKTTYITDGYIRAKKIRNLVIEFEHVSRRWLIEVENRSGIVFQALRYIGKSGASDHVIGTLADVLSDKDRSQLAKHSKDMPAWMQQLVQRIVAHA